MKTFIFLVFIFVAYDAISQQTFNKLNVNQLKLPAESTEKVLTTDSSGQVKASTTSTTNLGYLDATSSIQTQIDTNSLEISDHLSSTTPHPVISGASIQDPIRLDPKKDTQANLVTYAATPAQNGEIVYATDTKKSFIVKDGLLSPIGSGGGSRLNLLSDGSFEDGVSEGSCSGCTATHESTIVLATPSNEKALKMTFSASSGCYTVDKSTTANFAGVQGAVRAWVKTDQNGVTLTPRRNGANTGNVIQVNPTSSYEYYEIADLVGSTSFGYTVCATSSITGDIYVDETFAGPSDVTGTSNSTQTFYARNTAAITAGVTAFANTSSSGDGCFTVQNSQITAIAPCDFTMSISGEDAAATGIFFTIQINGVSVGRSIPRAGSSTSLAGGTSFSKRLLVGDVVTFNSTATQFNATSIIATRETPTLSGLNKDTDWSACTAGSTQGFGTPTISNSICRRVGSDLQWRFNLTAGTVSASEARVTLPQFRGETLTISSQAGTILTRGRFNRSTTANPGVKVGVVLGTASQGYIGFSNEDRDTTINPLVYQLGNVSFVTAGNYYMEVTLPIEGWSPNAKVFASLENVPKTPNANNEVIYRANIDCDGSSSITSQKGNWLSSVGNISSGQCVLNFTPGSFLNSDYQCTYDSNESISSALGLSLISRSTSSATFRCRANNTGTSTDCTSLDFDIICVGEK